jgi:putative methionine-R-sulfoxide reductase with GAF domain
MKKEITEYLKAVELKIEPAEIPYDPLGFVKNTSTSEVKFLYPVPKLTKDGTCSSGDELEEEPYDLLKTARLNGIDEKYFRGLVRDLDRVVESLSKETGADWTGIYKSLRTPGGPALVKLAYRGRPSRAEFPLSESFARHSNNSRVGLSGKAVVVQDVERYTEAGGSYYECDARVRSEICLPVFSESGLVVGIVDLESFEPGFFTPDKIILAAAFCVALGSVLGGAAT